MPITLATCLVGLLLNASAQSAIVHADTSDLRVQIVNASEKGIAASQWASPLLRDGHSNEATAAVLSAFPEPTRTPVETLVLGNVLFGREPELSYQLHKLAAARLPESADAQLEWALEQHRAKQYDGAITAYARFSALRPEYAPVHALAAECLIRTNRMREAVEAWQKFERGLSATSSSDGGSRSSIEAVETLIGELHAEKSPDRRRATLMVAAAIGDLESAEQLIVLDCDWPRDWWTGGPHAEYLRHDLALVAGASIADSPRREAMLCAGELWLARASDIDDSVRILTKHGFLLDANATLPESGPVLSTMLAAAIAGDAISKPDTRRNFGDRILDMAKKSKDPEMFRAAALVFSGTKRLAEVDRLGWEITDDPRFAASYTVGRFAADEKFTLRSRPMINAIRLFPENSEIAYVAVLMAKREDRPLQSYLVAAIKAEYTHFSVTRGLEPRPSSRALRSYFGMLAKELDRITTASAPAK